MCEALLTVKRHTPIKQWKEFDALYEAGAPQLKNSVLNIYFKQMKGLKVIDMASIKKSKGKFKKLAFYDDLEKAHQILNKESRISKAQMKIIATAKANLIKLEKFFDDGYKLGSEVVTNTYEYIVMAILDATSILITSVTNAIVKGTKSLATIPFTVLEKFNKQVKEGKISHGLSKVNEAMLEVEVAKEGVVLTAMTALAAGALVLAFIPLIRELVFYFYYVRMSISDYLDQLSMYLKINEVEVKNNPNFDTAKKKDIIEKQDAWIKRLDELSDKIRVQQSTGEKSAKQRIESEDNKVDLNEVKDELTATDAEVEPPTKGGFDF